MVFLRGPLSIAVLLVAACGRIGFDGRSGTGDGTGDGNGDATLGDARGDGPPGGGSGEPEDGGVDASGVCPGTVPAMCAPCSGTAMCTVAGSCCTCTGGGWLCYPPNPAQCPTMPPMPFSACSPDGLQCTYCNLSGQYQCDAGQWLILLTTCAV